MKLAPHCLFLLLAGTLLTASCQSPADASKSRLSYLDLSRTRVPDQPQHPLFTGVTLSADQTTTSATGEQEFTGHIFCDGNTLHQTAIQTGRPDLGWPLYATAKEATWDPAANRLELRGYPAIQFPTYLLETLAKDAVITVTPSNVNVLGESKTTLLSPP